LRGNTAHNYNVIFAFYTRDAALAIIESNQWEKAMTWRAKNDEEGRYTPLNLLITHMPGSNIIFVKW